MISFHQKKHSFSQSNIWELGYWGDHANQIVHQGSGLLHILLEMKILQSNITGTQSSFSTNFGGKLSFTLSFLFPERPHHCFIYFHCSYFFNYYNYSWTLCIKCWVSSYWDLIKFHYFADPTGRGDRPWKQAQTQGEDRVTSWITLLFANSMSNFLKEQNLQVDSTLWFIFPYNFFRFLKDRWGSFYKFPSIYYNYFSNFRYKKIWKKKPWLHFSITQLFICLKPHIRNLDDDINYFHGAPLPTWSKLCMIWSLMLHMLW
jgi:hypothetical protein